MLLLRKLQVPKPLVIHYHGSSHPTLHSEPSSQSFHTSLIGHASKSTKSSKTKTSSSTSESTSPEAKRKLLAKQAKEKRLVEKSVFSEDHSQKTPSFTFNKKQLEDLQKDSPRENELNRAMAVGGSKKDSSSASTIKKQFVSSSLFKDRRANTTGSLFGGGGLSKLTGFVARDNSVAGLVSTKSNEVSGMDNISNEEVEENLLDILSKQKTVDDDVSRRKIESFREKNANKSLYSIGNSEEVGVLNEMGKIVAADEVEEEQEDEEEEQLDLVSNPHVSDKMFNLTDLKRHSIRLQQLARENNLEEVENYFNSIPFPNTFHYNIFMSIFARNNQFERVEKIFADIPYKNTSSYNIMLEVYLKQGKFDAMEELFKCIPRQDEESWNILMEMFEKKGELEKVKQSFKLIEDPSIENFNTLLAIFYRAKRYNTIKVIFEQ